MTASTTIVLMLYDAIAIGSSRRLPPLARCLRTWLSPQGDLYERALPHPPRLYRGGALRPGGLGAHAEPRESSDPGSPFDPQGRQVDSARGKSAEGWLHAVYRGQATDRRLP